jgi:hypothetical protein
MAETMHTVEMIFFAVYDIFKACDICIKNVRILLIIMQVKGLSVFRTFISGWRGPSDYRPRNGIQIFGEKKI